MLYIHFIVLKFTVVEYVELVIRSITWFDLKKVGLFVHVGIESSNGPGLIFFFLCFFLSILIINTKNIIIFWIICISLVECGLRVKQKKMKETCKLEEKKQTNNGVLLTRQNIPTRPIHTHTICHVNIFFPHDKLQESIRVSKTCFWGPVVQMSS